MKTTFSVQRSAPEYLTLINNLDQVPLHLVSRNWNSIHQTHFLHYLNNDYVLVIIVVVVVNALIIVIISLALR